MRLRDPPEKGWSHSKASWHIFIWSTYLVVVAVVSSLYLTVPFMHDIAAFLVFLVPFSFAALFYSVDFSNHNILAEREQRSPARKRESLLGNLLVMVWGVGVAFLVGSLYSYLVLSRVGLREPYVSLTAVMSLALSVIAIGFFLLGKRISKSREEKNPLFRLRINRVCRSAVQFSFFIMIFTLCLAVPFDRDTLPNSIKSKQCIVTYRATNQNVLTQLIR